MLPLNMDRDFNAIIIFAGLMNIGMALVLVPHYHEVGMAFSVLATEVLVPIMMVIILRWRGQHPWASPTAISEAAA